MPANSTKSVTLLEGDDKSLSETVSKATQKDNSTSTQKGTSAGGRTSKEKRNSTSTKKDESKTTRTAKAVSKSTKKATDKSKRNGTQASEDKTVSERPKVISRTTETGGGTSSAQSDDIAFSVSWTIKVSGQLCID